MLHHCTEPGCDASFQRPYRLKQHLLKHAGKKPFECDEDGCSKSYTNQSHLRRHKLKVHEGIKPTTKRCPVKDCLRMIATDNLRRHLQTVHKVEDVNVCTVCNKGFHKKNHLRSHMFEHTGVKPFICEYCPLAFVNITDYKKHQRLHRLYTCECKEVFYQWSAYLKHRREAPIHQKNFCETCKKQFNCLRNYKIHLTTHKTNREVFECPMENCERLYYYKKNLKDHIDTYHLKIKPKSNRSEVFPCPMENCSRIYNYKKNLKDHIDLYHLKTKLYPWQRKDDTTTTTTSTSRKDKGTFKKSTALKLVGLSVEPYEAEKSILAGEPIQVTNEEELIDNSDISDIEISVKILKDVTSSEDEARQKNSICNEVK